MSNLKWRSVQGINMLVRATVIRKEHSFSYSIDRGFSDLLRKIGIGDKADVHVADMKRPVSFKAVMRLHGNKYYIHIPRWAVAFYEWGEEVELVITILGIRR